MRRLTLPPWPATALLLLLLGLSLAAPPPAALSQAPWSSDPTFRYAGQYEGEWTAEVRAQAGEQAAGGVFEERAGQLRGTLSLEVDCDGSLTGQAQGQTHAPLAVAAIADGPEGPRVLSAALDLVAHGAFDGSLAARGADGRGTVVEAGLEGILRDLPGDAEMATGTFAVQRWYTGPAAPRWEVVEGQPGRLAGTWEGVADLAVEAGPYQPALALRSQGRWVVTRRALALCPWRGTASASGAFANEQRHEERLEFTFWPTGDGQVRGEGTGEARISGGNPTGCTYSGGGPFAVQVVGEHQAGRFRLRLEDHEHAQLLVTTTCGGGRFVGPQATLTTAFGAVDLPEAAGAQARLEVPASAPDLRGTLDVTIVPSVGAAPP